MARATLYDGRMATGGSLGDAYIQVHADTSRVGPEMEEGVRKAANDAEKSDDFDGLVKAADKAGSRAGDEAGKSFIRDAGNRLRTDSGEFADSAGTAGANAASKFSRDAAGRLHDEAGRFVSEATKMGNDAGKALGDSTGKSSQSSLKKNIGRLGELLAPSWIKTIGVWVGVIGPGAAELAATLIPVVSLTSALVPVAIGGAASLGILKLAFSGVSKALKDVNGPTKTFNKDLKDLTPSQKAFVLSIKDLNPQLKTFKASISGAFFDKFKDTVSILGKTLLPAMTKPLDMIASALGSIGKGIATALTQKSAVRDLATILSTFAGGITTAGGAIPALVGGILRLGAEAAPVLKTISGYIVLAAQKFGAWIQQASQDGSFKKWLDDGMTAAGQLFSLVQGAYTIVSSILSAAGKTGGGNALVGTLGLIAQTVQGLSKNGGLEGFFKLYNQVFSTLGAVITPLLKPLGQLAQDLGTDLTGDLKDLTPALVSLVQNGLVPLVGLFDQLLPVINPIVKGIAALLVALTAHPAVVKAVTGYLIAYFVAVKVSALAETIIGVATATDILTGAMTAFDVAADANPIGAVVLAIEALGVAAYFAWKWLDGLAQKAGGWGKLWDDIVSWIEGAWNAILKWIENVGKAIGNFFTQTIPKWWDTFVAWINGLPGQLLSFAEGIGKALLDGIVNFFKKLPGELWKLIKQAGGLLLEGVGLAIGLILAAFKVLPGKILGFVEKIYNDVVEWFGKLPGRAWKVILDIVDYFKKLPGKVYSAVSSLLGKIGTFFSKVWDAAYSKTRSGIGKVVSFVAGLPAKIGAFAGKMGSAGVKLISRLFTGLASGKDISKVAGSIVSHVKDGLNWAIKKVNAGINKIGHAIPGGLPNIPLLAKGGIIHKPTLAMIGERATEVVLPTDDLNRARQLLVQSGLASQLSTTPDVNVNVYIGDQQINDMVDVRIAHNNRQLAQQLAFGTR